MLVRSTTPLLVSVLLLAIFAASWGCSAPWRPIGKRTSNRGDNPPDAKAATSASSTAAKPVTLDTGAAPAPTNSSATSGPPFETEEPNLAAILQQVQQAGPLDPTAQARLIQELQRSNEEMWPLVVEQFRASLAYQRQLAERAESDTTQEDQSGAVTPVSWHERVEPHRPELPRVTSPPLTKVDPRLNPGDPPSSRIGSLVDPRDVRRARNFEPEASPAGPTRQSASPLPAEFAEPEGASPIEGTVAFTATTTGPETPHIGRGQEAIQARFERVNGESQRATPTRLEAAMPPSPANWQSLVAEAAETLQQQAARSPQSTAEIHEQASLRLLRLLAGRTEESLEPIPRVSPVEQDYWSRQLFALATFLDHEQQPDDRRRAAASAAHLDDAVVKLRELGSLSLRNLTFCRMVHGYGDYEPYESAQFASAQEVSIYVEVENYRSEATEKGYVTKLGATFEVLDDQGTRVDGGAFPLVEDCCRSRRRDFHVQYGLALPPDLKTGSYRLVLVVKDEQSDKLASSQLRFTIAN